MCPCTVCITMTYSRVCTAHACSWITPPHSQGPCCSATNRMCLQGAKNTSFATKKKKNNSNECSFMCGCVLKQSRKLCFKQKDNGGEMMERDKDFNTLALHSSTLFSMSTPVESFQ
eukprot:scpid52318/ scgid31857/ 